MKVCHIDLFSGIGGFVLALRGAGFDIMKSYHSDIEKYPLQVYAKRFSESVPLGDITKIDWHGLDTGGLPVIMTGGFPCQDLSVAGKRKGMHHEDGSLTRSGLWFEMLKGVEIIRPKVLVFENVGALVSTIAMNYVLSSLHDIGYECEWQDISAAGVGAPHLRHRIWGVCTERGSGFTFGAKVVGDERIGEVVEGEIVDGDSMFPAVVQKFPKAGKMVGGDVWQVERVVTEDDDEEQWATPNSSDEYHANMVDDHDIKKGYLRGQVQRSKWPTPDATQRGAHTGKISGSVEGNRRIRSDGTEFGATLITAVKNKFATPQGRKGEEMDLPTQVKRYPTPSKQDGENNGGPSQFERNSLPLNALIKQEEKITGQLNPDWVEFLMGVGRGFTDIDCECPEEFDGWEVDPADEMVSTRNWPTPRKLCDIKANKNRGKGNLEEEVVGDTSNCKTPRLTTVTKNRANRLKALGNGIVWQCALVVMKYVYGWLTGEKVVVDVKNGVDKQWHTPTRSDVSPKLEKRMGGGKVRKSPIPNLAQEVRDGKPYMDGKDG